LVFDFAFRTADTPADVLDLHSGDAPHATAAKKSPRRAVIAYFAPAKPVKNYRPQKLVL
jgi:hypothetical protein